MKKTLRPINFAYAITYIGTAFLSISTLFLIFEALFDNCKLNIFEWVCVFASPTIFWIYTSHQIKEKLVLGNDKIIIVKSVWLKKEKGSFLKLRHLLFSFNGCRQQITTDTLDLTSLYKYGLAKDFQIPPNEHTPFFNSMYSNLEIVFFTKDESMIFFNSSIYTRKNIRKLISHIKDKTEISPEGKLQRMC